MKTMEKNVTYPSTNTYSTLNQLTANTRNIWFVFHGIGHLSRYFLDYFDALPADENYIIAPQAPSKYYLKNDYRHIGASWLTRENTVLETGNLIAYLDAVYKAEEIPVHCKVIVLGFSQGVSIAARWVVRRQIDCSHLVLYAGGMPKELNPDDFMFLKENETKVRVFVGDADAYLTQERLKSEWPKIDLLFDGMAELVIFKGGHELKKELLHTLIS